MKNEHFQEAFNEIDDSFIKEASSARKRKRKFYTSPVFYSAVAAVIVFFLAIPFFSLTLGTKKGDVAREDTDNKKVFDKKEDSEVEYNEETEPACDKQDSESGTIPVSEDKEPDIKDSDSTDSQTYESIKATERDKEDENVPQTTGSFSDIETHAVDDLETSASSELSSKSEEGDPILPDPKKESKDIIVPGEETYKEHAGKDISGEVDIAGEALNSYGKSENGVQTKSHVLTASTWDDNLNYAKWKELFLPSNQNNETGKFYIYLNETWKLSSLHRLKVYVGNENTGIFNAKVTVSKNNADEACFTAVTDVNGYAYLFLVEEGDTIKVSYENETLEKTVGNEESLSFSFNLYSKAIETLDLMFAVDVTGSMGDEISFLKNEIQDVIKRIQTEYNVNVRISFVYYRDTDDEELVYLEDFTDAGQASYLKKLKSEEATGGGDYEEAIDIAFEKTVNASWNTSSVKVMFHFFDAPLHDKTEVIASYSDSVKKLASMGVRICPVIASGADVFTEYLARLEAIISAGQFCYLTDDSGIGGTHHNPELDTVVEYLDDMLVRIVGGYITGTQKEPVPYQKELSIPVPTGAEYITK